jgi:hypothetical protein
MIDNPAEFNKKFDDTYVKKTPERHLPTPDEVIQERDSQYGQAWFIAGQVIRDLTNLHPGLFRKVTNAGYMYAWITIMCKLIRACASPYKRDHWVDIAGYAQMVVTDIDTTNMYRE